MSIGSIAGNFLRSIGTIVFKGERLAAENIRKVASKEMSIFDFGKEFTNDVSKFAKDRSNSILPSNPFKNIRDYWKKHSGTDFSWKELWKESKLGEWLVPAGIVLPEVGNVYRSFTDEKGGVGTGLLEVGKTTARVVGGSLGAILGTLIPIPILGPIAGYMAGDWLAGRIVGSSFTEKSGGSGGYEEAGGNADNPAANPQNAQYNPANNNGQIDYSQYPQQYNPVGYNYNPFNTGLNPSLNNYADDFMAQSIFGNPYQQQQNQATMPSFNGSASQVQPNDPIGKLGYLS